MKHQFLILILKREVLKDGRGIDALYKAVATLVGQDMVIQTVALTTNMASLRAKLYQANAVESESYLESGECQLDIAIPRAELNKILAAEKITHELIGVDVSSPPIH